MKQYIGARYVPKIMGEWNNQQVYEPFSVVLYLGSSYTSVTTVPAGTVPTNQQYWVLTGNYNAQVEEYRQEVVTLENNVTELNHIVNPKKRFFLILGDSYGVVADNWADKFLSLTGWPGVNFSHSGYGFTGSPYTFINAIKEYTGNKQQVTDIIVQGGLNDGNSTESEIFEAIVEFIQYCKTNFPNAQVRIGCTGWNRTKKSNMDRTLRAYQRCATIGGEYLNGVEFSCHNSSWMGSDNFHPNSVGSLRIANAYINAILTGKATCIYNGDVITLTPISGINISTAFFTGLDNGAEIKGAGVWIITGNLNLTAQPTLIATTDSPYYLTPGGPNQNTTTTLTVINGDKAYIVNFGFLNVNDVVGFYMWYTSNLTLNTRAVCSDFRINSKGID